MFFLGLFQGVGFFSRDFYSQFKSDQMNIFCVNQIRSEEIFGATTFVFNAKFCYCQIYVLDKKNGMDGMAKVNKESLLKNIYLPI